MTGKVILQALSPEDQFEIWYGLNKPNLLYEPLEKWPEIIQRFDQAVVNKRNELFGPNSSLDTSPK